MLIEILSAVLSGSVGGVAGWFTRKFKEPKHPSILYPPNGADGVYEVRYNTRTIYKGNDLQRAKYEFKRDEYAAGYVELYNNGNHVATRRIL